MYPTYTCHKQVQAFKIGKIDDVLIHPADPALAVAVVSYNFLEKHKPQVGGYYVVYEDGYDSYSPPAAFENGYSRNQ